MDELVKKPPALPAALVSKLIGGIARQSTGGRLGGHTLLKMSTIGVWQLGQANDKVQIGSKWLLNPASFRHGEVCWHESKIVGEHMVAGSEDRPPLSPPHACGQPYKLQLSVELRCMTGEDAGLQVMYKISSLGGTEELQRIVALIQSRGEILPDSQYMFPVVELKSTSYTNKNKGGGQTYNPVLDVVAWADQNGDVEDDDAVEVEQPAAKVKEKPPLNEQATGQRRRPR